MEELCGGGLATKSCPTLVTPWTIACQAPLSLEFSRQEYWSELSFPSPGIQTQVSCPSGIFFTDWATRKGHIAQRKQPVWKGYNWFQLYDILEKEKLRPQSKDRWLPETEGGGNKSMQHGEFLGPWK